jgi:hypothetical protein
MMLYRARAFALIAILSCLLPLSVVASGDAPPGSTTRPQSRTAEPAIADVYQVAAPQDAVLEWNRHAYEALGNAPTAPTPGAGQPPQVSILHLAMVQGAVYDAVNTIAGGYQPYLAGLPAAPGSASQAAAVATAAHHVLVGVVVQPPLAPAIIERLDTRLADSIAAATSADGPDAVAAGIAAGEAAAAAMLAARADDGRYVPLTIEGGTEPGQWRPTPPTNTSDPFAWVGTVAPFMLESPSQFRSKGPLAVTSKRYAREYNEVKTLGGPTLGSSRTAEQEAVAQFFTANPTELYNRAFRTLAVAEGLTLGEQARLFAMLNLAGADALINCFNDKAYFKFWRPITAIRLGDEDGNPKTVGDPDWTPMAATPSYSEHSSGYNCVTAAFMHTAAAYFGNGAMHFSLVKVAPGAPEVTREYARFTDVINDTIDARVYLGIHFRTADVQGAKIGKDVARWLDKHYFQAATPYVDAAK